MQKRGQLTLIILVGILVATLVGVSVYYKDEIYSLYWEYSRAKAEAIPEQVQEINDYIYSCIDQVTEEPLLLMGTQGGYIEIPAEPIPRSDLNPFSNSLEIIPGSSLRTAYWYYKTANNIESSLMPSREEMEAELENYVTNHLASCTNNLELFTRYNITAGTLSTDATIQDDSVIFTIEYPMQVATEDISYNFGTFYIEQPYPLGKLYDLSVQILNSENQEHFLEEKTFDMLVLYEELPLTEINVDCETHTWNMQEVEDKFKEIASANLANIIIKGTTASGSVDKYYQWDALKNNANDITSSVFFSPDWPLEMEIYPSQNEILSGAQFSTQGADKVAALLRQFLCLESYRFVYDIRYPVLISLMDENGYTFQFAAQVVIDNNQPRQNTAAGEEMEIDERLCSSLTQTATVHAYGISVSGSLYPLEDASIKYKCISSVCDIGKTGTDGSLTSLFPACVNGQEIAEKDGFKSSSEFLTTLETPSQTFIALEPKYNLNYEIMLVDAQTGSLISPSDQTITLTLSSQDGTEYISLTKSEGEIEIAQGEYSINGYVMKESGFEFETAGKQEKKCIAVPKQGLFGLVGMTEQKCYDIQVPELKTTSILTGGIQTTWQVSREELSTASGITFYLVDYGIPEDYDEINDIYAAFESGLSAREPELK